MKKRCWQALILTLVMAMVMSLTGAASASIVFYKDRNGLTYADFYYSNDDLMFSPELKNTGDKNINYIELAVFCTDKDFNPLYPEDGESGYVRYFDSSKGYSSGRVAPFGSCRMSGCKDDTAYVFCAVVKYRYRGGEMVDLTISDKTDVLDMYDWFGWAF